MLEPLEKNDPDRLHHLLLYFADKRTTVGVERCLATLMAMDLPPATVAHWAFEAIAQHLYPSTGHAHDFLYRCFDHDDFGELSKTDEWNHFSVVKKGDKSIHYLNGKVSIEGKVLKDPIGAATEFLIGKGHCCGNREFNGIVDEAFFQESIESS